MYEFKVGDKVKLNSGGSTMTIRKIESCYIHCYWPYGKIEMYDVYLPQMLTLVNE